MVVESHVHCMRIHIIAFRLLCASAPAWAPDATGGGSTARAQQPERAQDEKAAATQPSAEDAGAPPNAPAETSAAPLESTATAIGIEVEGKMEAGDRPSPPTVEARPPEATIVTGAGAGSDVAYASQFVVELGGMTAFTRRNDITMLRLAPMFGWFIIDNLEISLLPDLLLVHLDGETEVAAGFSLEPSYHVPLGDQVLLFGGLGLGARFGTQTEFAFRPRIGLDLLIGRSGILKPALFLDLGSAGGLSSGGLEIGYTIML
jgi:hypothetical protein